MSDILVRGIALDGAVRIFVAKTTDLVERARVIHDTFPAVSAALGRTLSVSAIMGSTLKDEDEKYVIEIRSDGLLKHILTNADNKGFVRGVVSKPDIQQVNEETGKLDVGGIIGSGFLNVERRRRNKVLYSSSVPLQTGEIGQDFVYYFAQSEQIPSALSVGVLVNEDYSIKSAGAIWVQVLPTATDADITKIEEVFSKLKPVSELMIHNGAEEVFNSLFEDARVLETLDLKYFCGCNRTQMKAVIRALPNEEIQTLIDEDHGATLICQYCGTEFKFNEEDLINIMNNVEDTSETITEE